MMYLNKILDKMVKEIKDEMPYHIKRWYNQRENL